MYLYQCNQAQRAMGMIALVVVSEGGEVSLNDVRGAKVKGNAKRN